VEVWRGRVYRRDCERCGSTFFTRDPDQVTCDDCPAPLKEPPWR
jgi:uncharacterized OB-fold protein